MQHEVTAAPAVPEHFERGPRVFSRRGADDDSAAFVVRDGHYLSARRPGDAYLFAKRFAEPPARRRPA